MTPEIEELKKQREELSQRIKELELVEAQKVSGFAIGDVIEFGCKKVLRGRVVSVYPWCVGPQVEMRVVSIRKDGSDGVKRTVNHWHEPRHIATGDPA
jgi:hypothetical protein